MKRGVHSRLTALKQANTMQIHGITFPYYSYIPFAWPRWAIARQQAASPGQLIQFTSGTYDRVTMRRDAKYPQIINLATSYATFLMKIYTYM